MNVKLSNLQLYKLRLGIKNGTEVTLKTSSNVVGVSNDNTNFPYKLLSTNTLLLRLHIAPVNNSSAYIKLSQTKLSRIGQSGGFLGRL